MNRFFSSLKPVALFKVLSKIYYDYIPIIAPDRLKREKILDLHIMFQFLL